MIVYRLAVVSVLILSACSATIYDIATPAYRDLGPNERVPRADYEALGPARRQWIAEAVSAWIATRGGHVPLSPSAFADVRASLRASCTPPDVTSACSFALRVPIKYDKFMGPDYRRAIVRMELHSADAGVTIGGVQVFK